jgi:hypothetical protein
VATGSVMQGRGRRGGGGRRRVDGDNGAARWLGRHGAGQGIPVLGDGPGVANWAEAWWSREMAGWAEPRLDWVSAQCQIKTRKLFSILLTIFPFVNHFLFQIKFE